MELSRATPQRKFHEQLNRSVVDFTFTKIQHFYLHQLCHKTTSSRELQLDYIYDY
jgi:hypothetical protein